MLPDEMATRRLGAALADIAAPGLLVLIGGPLGAGKTTLVDAFVRALGGAGATSPTFVLAHKYDGARLPIWHLDLYRLDDPREAVALDLDAYASNDGVTIVEWFDRAPDAWPADRLTVLLSIAGAARRAEIAGSGAQTEAARRALERLS